MDAESSSAPVDGDRVRRESMMPAETYRPPTSPAEKQLARIWSDALNLDRVGIEDDFFVLGGDSMAATVICSEVERLTSRRVGPSLLMDASTVATFATAIDSDLLERAGEILVPSRVTGTKPPLVLLHGLDGNVFFVRRLSWALPEDQPVYAVQARGLDGTQEPHESVEHMARDYADAIFKEFGSREIVLGGFCMGGIIAIDVLRHLMRRGGRALRLVLIDPPPNPGQHSWTPTEAEQEAIKRVRGSKIARRMASLVGGRPDLAAEYGPDGARLQNALRVADSLARAYAHYRPHWTRLPATILWSVDRAAQLTHEPSRYILTRGPTRAYVVRNRRFDVTHQLLMSRGLETVARLLQETIARSIAIAAEAAASAGSRPAGASPVPAGES